MALNLHATVRGAIQSVNPDRMIVWLVSTGNTVAAGGKSTPSYAAPANVRAQIQPVKGQDLKKYAFLQAQGVYRAVYLFSDAEAINRVDAKGGDLLQFPQIPGGTVRTWLVTQVDETWSPDIPDTGPAPPLALGWCRVIVTLQMDPSNP